jgi:hypothetical protein
MTECSMLKRHKINKRGSLRTLKAQPAKAATPRFRNIDAWFAEFDRFADVPFMEDGRRQPLSDRNRDFLRSSSESTDSWD